MSWTRIIFEHTVKTHAMPTTYADAIVEEYRAQGIGLHPGFEDNRIYAVQPVTEWGFDLGGSCIMGRPFEVFNVDGLSFELPSEEVGTFYEYWLKEALRYTASGLPYYKLKGSGCLVVTPTMYAMLLHDMQARIPAAEARSEAFLLEWTQKHPPVSSPFVTPELADKINSKRRGN